MGTNVDETLAGAGIFHPVEPDAASAPTIGMHGVDVPRPNNFRRHRQDQSPARGLGGPALGLWDRGEERGPPGTPRREGDADGVAERCSTRPGRRSNPPGGGPTGWQSPDGADGSGDAANEIAMRRVAVQVSAVQ